MKRIDVLGASQMGSVSSTAIERSGATSTAFGGSLANPEAFQPATKVEPLTWPATRFGRSVIQVTGVVTLVRVS